VLRDRRERERERAYTEIVLVLGVKTPFEGSFCLLIRLLQLTFVESERLEGYIPY
jgi:hypothetical protein